MPDNNWELHDSFPVSLAQEFTAVPSPWTEVYWGPFPSLWFNPGAAPAFNGDGAAIAAAATGTGSGELVFVADGVAVAGAPTSAGAGEEVFVGDGAAVQAVVGAGSGQLTGTASWDGGGGGYPRPFKLGGQYRARERRKGRGVAVASAPVGRGTGTMQPAPRVRAWQPPRPTIAFVPPQPRILGHGRAGAASARGFGSGHQADLLEYLVGAGVLDDLD